MIIVDIIITRLYVEYIIDGQNNELKHFHYSL